MLSLYCALSWDCCSHQLVSIHGIENTEPECSSRCEDILGVLCDINRLDGLLDVEDTDSCAVVCVVHAYIAVIRAGEEKVSIEVVHDLSHWSRVARQIDRLHLCFWNY